MHIQMKVSNEIILLVWILHRMWDLTIALVVLFLFLIQLMIPTIEYLDYDFSSVSFDSKDSAR